MSYHQFRKYKLMIKKGSCLITNPLPNSSTSCNKDSNGDYGTWDRID